MISPRDSEHQLNTEVFNLAFELFGIKKYWHKRIVRAGKNTLFPYKENPPDLILKSNDVVFFDFGPVFENWEADIGKTFVLGANPQMLKLKQDVESTFWYIHKNQRPSSVNDWHRKTLYLQAKQTLHLVLILASED